MQVTAIAERYAEALLEIGVERGIYEQLGQELRMAAELFDPAVNEGAQALLEVFINPKILAKSRKAVLGELLTRLQVSAITRNFLNLLVDRRRMDSLLSISVAYGELADQRAGRVRAKVTVARSMGEAEAARLRNALRGLTGRQVVLEERVDPSILGGIITEVEGKIYDGSLRAQINTLKSQLTLHEA